MINDLTVSVFGRKWLKSTMTASEVLSHLSKLNLLHLGNLGEQALQHKGAKLCTVNEPGIDTINGVQIKTAQTHLRQLLKDPRTLKAFISVANATGPIAAQVLEELTGKTYYFWIPEKVHKSVQANTFSIPFESNGAPRTVPKRITGVNPNWWDHRIKTYKQFCKLVNEHKEQS
jgi:hypothetical protein